MHRTSKGRKFVFQNSVIIAVICLLSYGLVCFVYNRNYLSEKYITYPVKFADRYNDLLQKSSADYRKQNLHKPKSSKVYMLVIFTSLKYTQDNRQVIDNTINNWSTLSSDIKCVLFSNDTYLTSKVKEYGWDVLPISKTIHGIPILKYMYLQVMENYDSLYYSFSNSDILFSHTLLTNIIAVANSFNKKTPSLIVGQRVNVKDLRSSNLNFEYLHNITNDRELFTRTAEDYFITSSNYPWSECPDVVIGRHGYDNWLVINARQKHFLTIDATHTLLALHQSVQTDEYASHHNHHPDINIDVLEPDRYNINFDGGRTSCTKYFTTYNEFTMEINVNKRIPDSSCFPI